MQRIEEFSTQELVDELKSRFDSFVISRLVHRTKVEDHVYFRYKYDDFIACQSLCINLLNNINYDLIQKIKEENR